MFHALEVDPAGGARAIGMPTTPHVFPTAEAWAMDRAGAGIIVARFGFSTGDPNGAETALGPEDCPAPVDEWDEAAPSVNPGAVILARGGPVPLSDDPSRNFLNTRSRRGIHGAPSLKRPPTRGELTKRTRALEAVRAGT